MDVNEAFKKASKFILGQEIGEMKEYEGFLKEAALGRFANSSFSKERVFVTSERYCDGARFFDYGKDQKKLAKEIAKPININRIKDIDSLFEAAGEKCFYAGGKVLGKSSNVVDSDNVIDSEHVLNSSVVMYCRYIAYSYMMRKNEYMFGCTSTGDSSWNIRCFDTNTIQRCFESALVVACRDCYFSYNLDSCYDCMFTFSEKAKHHMIGNIQLEKEEYKELKKKLLGEALEQLKRSKRLNFSITGIPQLED